jgi:hypothetical protein
MNPGNASNLSQGGLGQKMGISMGVSQSQIFRGWIELYIMP